LRECRQLHFSPLFEPPSHEPRAAEEHPPLLQHASEKTPPLDGLGQAVRRDGVGQRPRSSWPHPGPRQRQLDLEKADNGVTGKIQPTHPREEIVPKERRLGIRKKSPIPPQDGARKAPPCRKEERDHQVDPFAKPWSKRAPVA